MSEHIAIDNLKYDFRDDIKPLIEIGKEGLFEEVVREISQQKKEPQWMLDYRLESFNHFLQSQLPDWGPDLSGLNFDEILYFAKASEKPVRTWDEVPEKIKETFERIGVPQAEREALAGVVALYDSEAVYNNIKEIYADQGVIFLDMDSAVKEYPDMLQEYFGKLVSNKENFQTGLNGAVWSGGTFIYVPKHVKVNVPLQTYFRMNEETLGQFERTVIIVDEGASIEYIEGCTAPTYSSASLHAAIVEVYVKKGGYCRYSSVQNWSGNVYNLVTKRAHVEAGGTMEWVDGNIGSYKNMKYPACILDGEGARGTMLSVAFAGDNQHQDTGAKMYHRAPNTSSTIISKSIAKGTGRTDYRGEVDFSDQAAGSKSHIECDTILVDQESTSDTLPFNRIKHPDVVLEHEAKVSKISQDQLYYLMSRGLTEEEATAMIITGFVEPISKELPLEYAVELNRLIAFEMEGSVG